MADLDTLKPVGFGGTSFIPPFKYIEEEGLEPDCLVYLTDLVGPFPTEQPRYPVLWGRTIPSLTPPWGDAIDIPIKAKK